MNPIQQILSMLGVGGQQQAPVTVAPTLPPTTNTPAPAPAVGSAVSGDVGQKPDGMGQLLAQLLGQHQQQQPFDIAKLGQLLHPPTTHLGMSGQDITGKGDEFTGTDPLAWLKANKQQQQTPSPMLGKYFNQLIA